MATIKNTLAVMARVFEQAVRVGLIDANPARVTGWQREFHQAEEELDDPRAPALDDWDALDELANALVARSADRYEGWGDVVRFAACTATRIGEVSGLRAPRPGDRPFTVDLDGLPADDPRTRRSARQGNQGETAAPGTHHSRDPADGRAASGRAGGQADGSACSPGRGAGASQRPSCGTPRTGTRWSSRSGTSTCVATTYGTPG
ncbi:hypothetical protein [Streptomyces sedi]|uniref:hypothetical protein n=1 Tax=Streptomyces sedi TaxID=555059 RepID=UPI0031ED4D46